MYTQLGSRTGHLKPAVCYYGAMQIRVRTGFTIVELLVVLAIVGLLVGIVFASFSDARATARDKQRKADVGQIQLALKLYQQENGRYPEAVADGEICPSCSNDITSYVRSYGDLVPEDPQDGSYRYYASSSCGPIVTAASMELPGNSNNDSGNDCGVSDEYIVKLR